jgi:hypothetical protein
VSQKLTERQGRHAVGIGLGPRRGDWVATERPHPALSEKWLNSRGRKPNREPGGPTAKGFGGGSRVQAAALARWKPPSRDNATRGCHPLKGSHAGLRFQDRG